MQQVKTQPTLSAAALNEIQRLYGDTQNSIKAIEWLVDQGFVPVSIVVGRSKRPLIRIEECSQCMQLKRIYHAYPYMLQPGPRGREIVWRSVIYGCIVEWKEVGNAQVH